MLGQDARRRPRPGSTSRRPHGRRTASGLRRRLGLRSGVGLRRLGAALGLTPAALIAAALIAAALIAAAVPALFCPAVPALIGDAGSGGIATAAGALE